MSPRLNELLQQTSRSFYLTLRILPRAVRPQISLAYLLARTSDTIADTDIVPVAHRLEALQQLRGRIRGQTQAALELGELARQQGLPAERQLLEYVEETLAALTRLTEFDLQLVRQVLETIIAGQELDLRRFELPANKPQIIALQNDAELDDYTYRVAGCVGEFWTRICRRHLFPSAALDEPQFLAAGIRFGKGLQLVNILRDLPRDLRAGRCYLPSDRLAQAGCTPADLLVVETTARFQPLFLTYLDLAETHLATGWDYANTIPFKQMRVRLACAWPILIGLETLRRLRVESVLDPLRRIKIPRPAVRQIVWRSLSRYPFPNSWRALARFSGGKPVARTPDLT